MPHSKRLTPEAADDERDESEASRNSNGSSGNHHNGEPNPQSAPNRRDENSISFRHFLQPHSDVVPTRTRNSRGTSSGSVDLVDGAAMALPDFVQDHLGSEGGGASASSSSSSAANNEVQGAASLPHTATGGCPLDLASNSHPEFGPSQCSANSYKKNRRQQDLSGLNLQGASCSQAAVALPDFLSDGPMQCSSNMTDGGILNSSAPPFGNGVTGSSGTGSLRSSSVGRNVESLAQEVERLRRELAEKNRRISQLESELSRQRSESSTFEAAYLNSEQGLQAATRRAAAGEARINELTEELRYFKNHFSDKVSLKSRDTANASTASDRPDSFPSSSNGHSTNPVNPNRVLEITFSAEALVGQLMQQLQSLKREALTPNKDDEVVNSKGKSKKKTKDESSSSHQ